MKSCYLAYTSQEQINYCQYNEKSDVWSLGCIVYELCTLKVPFQGKSAVDLSAKITAGKYPSIPTGYTDDLSAFIKYLLQVNVSFVTLTEFMQYCCKSVSRLHKFMIFCNDFIYLCKLK